MRASAPPSGREDGDDSHDVYTTDKMIRDPRAQFVCRRTGLEDPEHWGRARSHTALQKLRCLQPSVEYMLLHSPGLAGEDEPQNEIMLRMWRCTVCKQT